MKKPIQLEKFGPGTKVEIIQNQLNCIVNETCIGKQGTVVRFGGDYTLVVVKIGDRNLYCFPSELKVIYP